MKTTAILRERHYQHYDIRDEIWDPGNRTIGSHIMKKLAYSKKGDWIGNSVQAHRFVKKYGITEFEKRSVESCVCSIGFSPSKQKWYGWSHRAIFGFGIGDEVKEGDCTASSGWTDEYLAEHPEEDTSLPVGFIAKSLEDAKRMATAFAESVS